jgi:hypothetical protein
MILLIYFINYTLKFTTGIILNDTGGVFKNCPHYTAAAGYL